MTFFTEEFIKLCFVFMHINGECMIFQYRELTMVKKHPQKKKDPKQQFLKTCSTEIPTVLLN